jgi:hypothetical protein
MDAIKGTTKYPSQIYFCTLSHFPSSSLIYHLFNVTAIIQQQQQQQLYGTKSFFEKLARMSVRDGSK